MSVEIEAAGALLHDMRPSENEGNVTPGVDGPG